MSSDPHNCSCVKPTGLSPKSIQLRFRVLILLQLFFICRLNTKFMEPNILISGTTIFVFQFPTLFLQSGEAKWNNFGVISRTLPELSKVGLVSGSLLCQMGAFFVSSAESDTTEATQQQQIQHLMFKSSDWVVAQLVKNPPAGDPSVIPGLGSSSGEGDRLPTPVFLGFPDGSETKESICNVGDLGSIPGLGRSPGEGHGNPLQYSCLDRGAWQATVHGVTKNRIRLNA